MVNFALLCFNPVSICCNKSKIKNLNNKSSGTINILYILCVDRMWLVYSENDISGYLI